jgi:Leucine rich repeat
LKLEFNRKLSKLHVTPLYKSESKDNPDNCRSIFGLEHLERIWLWNNQLTSLPSNLFKHTRKMKFFFIEENELKRIKPRMFDLIPDDQWNRISLKTNERILYEPESSKGLKSLNELKNAIRATFVLQEEH